jgi:hypothetical protein
MKTTRNTTKLHKFAPWRFHKNNLYATTICNGRYSVLVFGSARLGEIMTKLLNRSRIA